jgi:FAD synthetase
MGEAGAAVEGRAAAAVRMIQRTVGLISPERCCLSFNGGKDSTVLLHLLRAALPDTYQQLHYV